MAVVQLENVCKRYGGAHELAVDSVNLTISDGEFMVLLGPSGCGKSTTLRMIAGLETISSGALSIGGRTVNAVPAKDRDIAMVFQSYALYPHMSVEDNLAFGLRRRRIAGAEIERRVGEAAAMLGLSELLGRKPHALSGGQRQRVALGRAIVREPKVFLFDEPLSNLDAALRVNMRNELVKLHHRLRSTMIYVTHDQVEAMTMGERICVMNMGRVVQIGRPLEVYLQPADIFVARFLGSPPMNLIDAEVGRDGEAFLAAAPGARAALVRWSGQCLAPYLGRKVVMGIRPEDLVLAGPGSPGVAAATIPASVNAVEALGAETLVVGELEGGTEIIARVGRETSARVGERIGLRLNPEATCLFDADTTRAIVPDREPAAAPARLLPH